MSSGFAYQLRQHAFKKRLGATLKHIVRDAKTIGSGIWRVGTSFGIAKNQRSHAFAKSAPELKDYSSADGNSEQRSTINLGVIHHASHVKCVLLHGRRAISQRGFAMAA